MGTSVMLVLTLMFITSVTAQAQKSCAEMLFDVIDKNSDGFIDVDEFKKCFAAGGKKDIDEKEFLKAIKDRTFDTCGLDPSYVFKTLSKNKGIMQLEEVFLNEYDTDDDNKISLTEFRTEHYMIFVRWMSETMVSLGGF